jgi:transmembrane sensor
MIGAWLYKSLAGETIETRLGERREISLSDGSLLQVDPETQLRVHFAEAKREIMLEHGRAFFRVARDPKRPFVVKASDTVVRVLGTSFAVDRGKQGTTVTVAEGKVTVSNAVSGTAVTQSAESELTSTVLTARQQLTVPVSGRPKKVRQVDPARELAWAEGRLVFDETPVASALEQFNRYNRLQLRVTDATLGATPITGVFDASEPESFVRFLETVRDVDVTREESGTPSIALGEASE